MPVTHKQSDSRHVLLRMVSSSVHWAAATETAVVLIAVLAIVLALATAMEGASGGKIIAGQIYASPWFVALFALLAVNILAAMLIRFPWNWGQTGFVMTHTGLLITLLSMMQTYVGGIDGRLVLAEGTPADSIVATDRNARLQLGFTLELLNFQRSRNPGGFGDAAFVSTIRLVDNRLSATRVADVSMNSPLTHAGFMFYQVDFAEVPGGRDLSVLGVTRDPGRLFKYLGVTLVCVGTLLTYILRTTSRTAISTLDDRGRSRARAASHGAQSAEEVPAIGNDARDGAR